MAGSGAKPGCLKLLYYGFNEFFPMEKPYPLDNERQKEAKYSLVELNKANVTLLLWLALTIPAMWIGGDTGSKLLSIATALMGVAFSQTEKILDHTDGKHFPTAVTFVLWCFCLPIVGGFIFGNTSSKDETITETAIVVSVLSGCLLLFIIVNLAKFCQWTVQDKALKLQMEEEKQYKEKNRDPERRQSLFANDDPLGQQLDKYFARTRELFKADDEKKEQEFEPLKLLMGASGLLILISLILVILGMGVDEEKGDVLTEASINVRLALLGISVAFSLLASQLCKILDENANGGPFIEFFIIFLSLTVDVLPLAIELTLTENENNPTVMTLAAWLGFGSAACFWILSSMAVLEKINDAKRLAESRDEEMRVQEAEIAEKVKQNQNMTLQDVLKNQDFKYKEFETAIADADEGQLREWEQQLAQEGKNLEEKKKDVEVKAEMVQKLRKSKTRDIDPPPPPQLPPTPPPELPEEEYLYVPQGYYPESYPSSGPVPATHPVKTGLYVVKRQPQQDNQSGQMMPGTSPAPQQPWYGMQAPGMGPGMPQAPGGGSAAPFGMPQAPGGGSAAPFNPGAGGF